jgi:hypothetical protein
VGQAQQVVGGRAAAVQRRALVGASRPKIIRMVVVFPAQLRFLWRLSSGSR